MQFAVYHVQLLFVECESGDNSLIGKAALNRCLVNNPSAWMASLRTTMMRRRWVVAVPLFLAGTTIGTIVPAPVNGEPLSPEIIRITSVAASSLEQDVRQLALLIGGIVSYTRWPQTPNPLRICVLGRDDLVAQLRSESSTAGSRIIVANAVKPSIDFKSQCEVVYVTAIPPENAKVLLQKTVAMPIVTIGEGVEFCSDGGMFCLISRPGSTLGNARLRFSANLDVISRSGLRVNPQVLLMAKSANATSP